MNESAWVIAVLLPEQRLVIQISISIEIDRFNWTTGHSVRTQDTFRRGLMDRIIGEGVMQRCRCGIVINPNISLK